jgi:hypothetical protein
MADGFLEHGFLEHTQAVQDRPSLPEWTEANDQERSVA